MKKKVLGLILAGAAGAFALAGCAGGSQTVDDKTASLKPGTYTGQSSENDEEGGGYATVSLTIGENNAIENVVFETFEKNGKSKYTEEYGKINGEASNKAYYEKAQKAVEASKGYAEQYMKVQSLTEVDAVSGATISYNQFVEAVQSALQKAAQ